MEEKTRLVCFVVDVRANQTGSLCRSEPC